MPNIDLSILNQRQTPAFFADTLANRPAAGFLGRIFVSTDTFAFYRDNGTGWDLIGGPGTGTITGSGAAGQVTFFNGTSSITGDSGLTYNDVTNALTSLGTIKATNYYVGTPSDLTRSFAAKGDANTVALWLEEYGSSSASPDIFMFKGRGSSAAPTNISVGDSTGAITTGGYVNGLLNGSTTLSTPVVNIDNTNNYANSDLVLQQTYNSITPNENFRVRAIDGYVVASNGGFETTGNINLFAGANSRRIIFDANNGVPRIFSFRTGNLPRWAFRVDGTESGSSSGSDLAIRRYDDAGTFVDAPLSINRASGQSTFAKKVVIENNTGDQQLQIVSTTAPSIRIDNAQTGATKRAGLGISTAANNFIQGSVDRDFCIFNGSTTASPMLFGIYDAGLSNTQEAARISAARNFIIGSSIDNGNKLQINGNVAASGNYQGVNSILSGYLQIGSTHSVKFDLTQSLSFDGIRVISNNPTTQNLIAMYHTSTEGCVETTFLGAGSYTNLALNQQGGNVLINTISTGADGLGIQNQKNVSFVEGSGESYVNIFRQRNSAAGVLAQGLKRSLTGEWASSISSSVARSAVVVGYNNGSIAFYSESTTTVANGTDITITPKMLLQNTGNLLIGTSTDNGNKLQVNGNQSLNGGLRYLDFLNPTSNYWDTYHYLDGTLRFNYNGAGGDEFILFNNGNLAIDGGAIRTSAPSGGTAQFFKSGSYVGGAPAATGYIQFEVNGVTYKLLAST